MCEVRGLNQERFLKLAKVLTLDIVLTIKAHFLDPTIRKKKCLLQQVFQIFTSQGIGKKIAFKTIN